MSEAKVTTDHETICRWVEERGGRPATVAATGDEEDAGILRIDFPDRGPNRDDECLTEIDWDRFFKTFEDRKLAFLHQDKTSDGATSRFSKFVGREG
jgi:hypothetical protein